MVNIGQITQNIQILTSLYVLLVNAPTHNNQRTQISNVILIVLLRKGSGVTTIDLKYL